MRYKGEGRIRQLETALRDIMDETDHPPPDVEDKAAWFIESMNQIWNIANEALSG